MPMEKKAKNILRYLFWAAVSAVLVYFCIRAINWAQFLEALQQCRWEWVVMAMVFGMAGMLSRGLRWHMLMEPFDPSLSRRAVIDSNNIGQAVNLVLPRIGDVMKLAYILKHSGKGDAGKRLVSFDKSLGTVITERVWDAIVVGLMSIVLLVVKWDSFGAFLRGGLSGVGAGIWWSLVGLSAVLAGLLILTYLLRHKGGIWSRIWGYIHGFLQGMISFRQMKRPGLFILHTVLIWGFYWLTSACIIWALQDMEAFSALGWADAFFLMIAGAISSLLPVPGGFGAYHGVVAGTLLSIWNIPMGIGMIYATLNHESQVLAQALYGLFSYIRETFFRK